MVRDYVLESGKTMNKYCKAMEFLSRSTPAPQQPCPYRLTSGLKRQYTFLNVPPASPTRLTARAVNYISFITLWHSLSDEKRKEKIEKYNQHLIKAKAFRDSYILRMLRRNGEGRDRRIVTRSWVAWNQGSSCLPSPHMPIWTCRCSTPLTIANRCHCPIAHSSEAPFTSGHPARSRCLVCVVSHSPVKSFFFIDEAEQIGKGAVVVVSQLHAFFHLHGLGEKRVTLQADNCVGQNKNTTMLWYLAWRVITGQHERIQLNFMLPGHTKFQPDSYFGLFKKHYRRQDHVDDMDDLVDCVRQCGQNVTCVSQLCKDWQYYDWNAYLGQCIMIRKTMPSDTNHTRVTMLRAGVTLNTIRDAYQSQMMPSVIKPSGLSLQRSLNLYEKMREFVHDPKKRDNVCPKPPPSTAGANASCTSRNVPLPPDNDQAGPSTAIPNPPTVEDHVSDDAYSEVQDGEVNDHVPGRRKRRQARSELILAYQCPACDRKYASSQALYQHRRNSHKQSPVAGGGGQSDVTDMVCDGEGSQGPSKRSRR
eukprot:Em0010g624a